MDIPIFAIIALTLFIFVQEINKPVDSLETYPVFTNIEKTDLSHDQLKRVFALVNGYYIECQDERDSLVAFMNSQEFKIE